MNGTGSAGTPAPSLESVPELRLLVLLHDLVRRQGQARTAAELGVHRKTVAAAVHTGRLSRRMQDPLGRLLLPGDVVGAPTGPAEDQRRPWEQRLAAALRHQREELLAAVSVQGQKLRDAAVQRTQAVEQRLAALESQRGADSGAATGNSGGQWVASASWQNACGPPTPTWPWTPNGLSRPARRQ